MKNCGINFVTNNDGGFIVIIRGWWWWRGYIYIYIYIRIVVIDKRKSIYIFMVIQAEMVKKNIWEQQIKKVEAKKQKTPYSQDFDNPGR